MLNRRYQVQKIKITTASSMANILRPTLTLSLLITTGFVVRKVLLSNPTPFRWRYERKATRQVAKMNNAIFIELVGIAGLRVNTQDFLDSFNIPRQLKNRS